MGRRPTISDLAVAAGVSVATVDRVLNQRHRVRGETAERVLAAAQSIAINPISAEMRKKNEESWTAAGGELISLPQDEQATMQKMLSSVGADVSTPKPPLAAAYKIVSEAAERLRAGM